MAVNSNIMLRLFTPNNIIFRVNRTNQVYPWNWLIYPSLLTSVCFDSNPELTIPDPPEDWTNFLVSYDKVIKDDFAMYNPLNGEFTIPLDGYWKITYSTIIFFQWTVGGVFNTGRMVLNGYVKKNANDRYSLSSSELSLIPTIVYDAPAQEVRTVQNSEIILFNKGDVFTIRGRILGGYDSAARENFINVVGNIDNFPHLLNTPSTNLLTGFKTLSYCTVQFIRPTSYIF